LIQEVMRMTTVVRKLFKHGNSKAVTLPKEFVDTVKGREVVIQYSPAGVLISTKSRLDTLEADPLFATFVRAIATDALKHPERLRDPAEAWSPEVVKLFNAMPHDDQE
jgi:antitoxin component of MazEF toxin-antitoxin module